MKSQPLKTRAILKPILSSLRKQGSILYRFHVKHGMTVLKQSLGGFTLVELLVAVSILAVLVTIGISLFSAFQKNNRDQERLRDLNTLKQALELYRSDNFSYPATLADLPVKYLETQPFDPTTGRTYQYQSSPISPACSTAAKNCLQFILCAKKEGAGTFEAPAGCSGLDCEGENDCSMGLSSD